MRRILMAFVNSWRGLRWTTRFEAAFREELIVLALAIPTACLLTSEPWERVALIGAVLFVMIVELLNTAVEKLSDRVTRAHDEQIGRVKDIGSAAVGLSIILALMIWTPPALRAMRLF